MPVCACCSRSSRTSGTHYHYYTDSAPGPGTDTDTPVWDPHNLCQDIGNKIDNMPSRIFETLSLTLEQSLLVVDFIKMKPKSIPLVEW